MPLFKAFNEPGPVKWKILKKLFQEPQEQDFSYFVIEILNIANYI